MSNNKRLKFKGPLLEEEGRNNRAAICRSAQNIKTSYKTTKPTPMSGYAVKCNPYIKTLLLYYYKHGWAHHENTV